MSGQYPPPNPYSRPHHQRPSATQGLWGQTRPTGMNIVGNPMNFYGSPHMALPARGTQPWVPPQTHPKPSDIRPGNNPLFGLQMMMSPEESQRIPSQYQQEETMDLSSHSSSAPDLPKAMSVRSENSDLLRNGAIPPSAELNGELERTGVAETEVKDSITTSVIATNPLRELREAVSDPASCERPMDSVVMRVDAAAAIAQERTAEPLTFPPMCTRSNDPVSVSEPVYSVVRSVTETSSIAPDSNMETPNSDSFEKFSFSDDSKTEEERFIGDTIKNAEEETLKNLEEMCRSGSDFQSTPKNVQPSPLNEMQSSFVENSSLSVDTDDSKLVVAESSTDDIFGLSPVDNTAAGTPQESQKSKETNSILSSVTTVADKPSSLSSDNQWPHNTASTVPPSEGVPEPNPSVENVETLLESMFNSQEETSCSSQTSSGIPQSVIVSSGAKAPTDVVTPQLDILTPMKEDELAMTLAEDIPEDKVKDKHSEAKVADPLLDEIERRLETLTESGLIERTCEPKAPTNNDFTRKIDQVKEEPEPDSCKENVDVNVKIPEMLTPNEIKTEGQEQKLSEIQPTQPKADAGTSSNPFIEVETELEKMFAGIVEPAEDASSDNPSSQPSVSDSKRPTANKRSVPKRKKANSRRPSETSLFGGYSGESSPVKKKGRKRLNESGSERASKRIKIETLDSVKKGKILKDNSNDSFSGKLKGPFVHIEGSKESPASVVVVNGGARADDEDGNDKTIGRRKQSLLHRPEGSRRSGPAYSSSTLSMRYNADTADLTWVCVFCKRGPHCAGGLGGTPAGDLFGPYRVPAVPPVDDAMPPGTPADRDVQEEQKKRGGKYPKSLRASGGPDQFLQKAAKKGKRSVSTESVEAAAAGLLSVEGGCEVWLHGACAEWAPGLCIIGTHLVGLDDAVWMALRSRCSQCGVTGAGVGCVVRNCVARVHYHCALLCGWQLNNETFIARCHSHRTRLRPS